MNPYERPHVDELVRLLTDDRLPPRIVAITGPRQSGKTTIVRQALRHVRATGLFGRIVAVDDPQAPRGLSTPGSESTVAPDPRLRTVHWLTSLWDRDRDTECP